MQNKIVALIMAAGNGSRLQSAVPKQYIKIRKKAVLLRALEPFLNHLDINGVAVVINAKHESLYQEHIPARVRKRLLPHIIGGVRRQDSVREGLQALQAVNPKYVLIHDAARIFTKATQISELIENMKDHEAAALGSTVIDTMCKIQDNKLSCVPRSGLIRLQTPQIFSYELIRELHSRYKDEEFTDDIGLLIKDQHDNIKIIESSISNFKITTIDDLKVATALLTKPSR